MTESTILRQTLHKLSAIKSIRFWRNNTGQAWMGKAIRLEQGERIVAQHGDVLIRGARPVRFGLPGSGDILGLAGPQGTFISVECKALTGEHADQQQKFQAMVERHGGVYILVRDADQAVDQLSRAIAAAQMPQAGQ